MSDNLSQEKLVRALVALGHQQNKTLSSLLQAVEAFERRLLAHQETFERRFYATLGKTVQAAYERGQDSQRQADTKRRSLAAKLGIERKKVALADPISESYPPPPPPCSRPPSPPTRLPSASRPAPPPPSTGTSLIKVIGYPEQRTAGIKRCLPISGSSAATAAALPPPPTSRERAVEAWQAQQQKQATNKRPTPTAQAAPAATEQEPPKKAPRVLTFAGPSRPTVPAVPAAATIGIS